MTATHTSGGFTGAAGGRIHWQAWQPGGRATAVVVVAHGVAEHGGRYAHVGERLAGAGFPTYVADHHGHGRSDGVRGNIHRMATAVADLDYTVGMAAEHHPGLPVFLLGHSLGGLIALDHVTSTPVRLRGLILSGAAVDVTVGTPLQRGAARLLSAALPNLGVLALDPSAVSRDPEVVRRYVADPLVHHGRLRARTAAEALAAVERVTQRLPGLRLPLLVLHGTADLLAAPSGASSIAERAQSPDVTLRLYDRLHHEILHEPEREAVLDDIVGWLDERSPVRES